MIINAIPLWVYFLNSLEATEIMKKFLALVLAAVMLLGAVSLAGCSSVTNKKDSDKGAQIQMYLCDYPTNLDPTAVSYGSQEQIKLFGLLYEGLYTIDEKGELDELVADEHTYFVDPLDDTLKLEITLRATRWSDGVPVDADDFVYAWQRLLKPGNSNPAAALLYPVKNAKAVKEGLCSINDLGVRAVKDNVIQISFEKEFMNIEYFMRRLASPALVPLREDNATKFDDASNLDYTWDASTTVGLPITNGAFKYKKLNTDTMELERNLHYDNVSQIEDNAPDKVVKPHMIITLYSAGKDIEDHMARFDNDEAFFVNLSSATAKTIEDAGKKVEQEAVPSTYTYFFDTTSELFSDARVRKALSISVDRDYINSLTGRDTKAAEGIVPFGIENTMEDTSFRKEGTNVYDVKTGNDGDLAVGDIEGAKALLKEAKVSGGNITIEYNNERRYERDIAEYVRKVWQKLGFKVTATGRNGKFVYGVVAGDTFKTGEARVLGMDFQCLTPDAYSMLVSFSNKFGGTSVDLTVPEVTYGANFTGYADEGYDAICAEIVVATGYEERAAAMHKAEEYLAESVPAMGLFYNVDVYVVSGKLDNLEKDMFGGRNFTEVTMKNYKKYLPEEEVIVEDEAAEASEDAE